MKPITFPGLGIEVNVSQIAFQLFGRDIYWYGIIIATSMLLCLYLASKDKNKFGLKWDDITTFVMYAIVIGFLSARIYYVIFKWDYYRQHLSEIIKIWNGGIAIYGGILGAFLTAFVFCKRKKLNFLNLCDFGVPYLALAQSIGRWGNFFNREAYGYATNSILRMGIFQNELQDYIYVHPTFLYESLITFSIFLLLLKLKKNRKFEGQILCAYMILYGIGRAVVEGLRTDSLMLGSFRISQVLAILLAAIFTGIYWWKYSKTKINK